MKISEVFEPGHRKVTMTVLAMVGVILLEKFGGGLSVETKNFILSVLGIFTGGNVLSKGIQAVKEVKVAKVDGFAIPPEGEPAPESELDLEARFNQLDQLAGQHIAKLNGDVDGLKESVKELSSRLDLQVKNLSKLLEIVNGRANSPTQPQG